MRRDDSHMTDQENLDGCMNSPKDNQTGKPRLKRYEDDGRRP